MLYVTCIHIHTHTHIYKSALILTLRPICVYRFCVYILCIKYLVCTLYLNGILWYFYLLYSKETCLNSDARKKQMQELAGLK